MQHPMKCRVKRLLSGSRVAVSRRSFKEWGLCMYADTLIVKESLSLKNQVTTLIHEAIHYLEPEFPERVVLRLEQEVVRSLTEDEIRFFHKRLKEVNTRCS